MKDTEERERQRRRQREKQAPCREPDVRLDFGTLRSRPGTTQALNRWPPRDSLEETVLEALVFHPAQVSPLQH